MKDNLEAMIEIVKKISEKKSDIICKQDDMIASLRQRIELLEMRLAYSQSRLPLSEYCDDTRDGTR